MNRRVFLNSFISVSTVGAAGCPQRTSDKESATENIETPIKTETTTVSPEPTQTTTSVETEKTPTKTPERGELPLPGEPIQAKNSQLGVQNVSGFFESNNRGFEGDADEYELPIEPQANFESSKVATSSAGSSVFLDVTDGHEGTGRAFGLATGCFQTAWEAPTAGHYRLSTKYHRDGKIYYDKPDNGDISASFDTVLTVTRYPEDEVVSEYIHPELQHKNGKLREEMAEWIIEKAVTMLIGNALGLSLIARRALRLIVGNLIELDQNIGHGDNGGYDVKHVVSRNPDPMELTTEFAAQEGDVFIFELAPNLGFSFELKNSYLYKPTCFSNIDWRSFHIERI